MPKKHNPAIHFAPNVFQRELLIWYERFHRNLPWRAKLGEKSNAYRVWLSEVMLQQTTVKAVIPYFEAFVEKWPTERALSVAPRDDVLAAWAGLGYYSRARNLHACAQLVARDGFPTTEAGLRALPGVGSYTAAAIAAIVFDEPAAVVDGNVERVLARLFALSVPLPAAKPAIRALAAVLTPRERPGDYAQAMMDLGATICTPRAPACSLCPCHAFCIAARQGEPEGFPVKRAKARKPVRRGDAFVIVRQQETGPHILLRRRNDKGLLGGMMEVPCTEWVVDAGLNGHTRNDKKTPSPQPSSQGESGFPRFPLPKGERVEVRGEWKQGQTVRHTFTHFHLEMRVFATKCGTAVDAADTFGGQWAALRNLPKFALPTVMKKAVAAGLEVLAIHGPGGYVTAKDAKSASTVSMVDRSAHPMTSAGQE